MLCPEHAQLFVYERGGENEVYTVVCNLSRAECALPALRGGEIVLQNCVVSDTLPPYGAFVVRTVN